MEHIQRIYQSIMSLLSWTSYKQENGSLDTPAGNPASAPRFTQQSTSSEISNAIKSGVGVKNTVSSAGIRKSLRLACRKKKHQLESVPTLKARLRPRGTKKKLCNWYDCGKNPNGTSSHEPIALKKQSQLESKRKSGENTKIEKSWLSRRYKDDDKVKVLQYPHIKVRLSKEKNGQFCKSCRVQEKLRRAAGNETVKVTCNSDADMARSRR